MEFDTSGKYGLNTIITCGVNAIVNFIPPMFIFQGFIASLTGEGAPPGSLGTAHQTGWSTVEKYIEFLDYFIFHVKQS